MCKVGKIIVGFDGSYLKTGDGPNSWEGVTKKVLAGDGSDVNGVYIPS